MRAADNIRYSPNAHCACEHYTARLPNKRGLEGFIPLILARQGLDRYGKLSSVESLDK